MRGHHRQVRRLLRSLAHAAVVACLCCAVGAAGGPSAGSPEPAAAIPAAAVLQTGWVTDAAGILPDEVERRLATKLAGFARDTQHQLVVVTVPTLASLDVAEFTTALGNAWGVGRAGYDDGIVLLVAPNERRARIALGYGMERLLSDEECHRIMEDVMLPRFRADDLPGGIEAGAEALIAHFE